MGVYSLSLRTASRWKREKEKKKINNLMKFIVKWFPALILIGLEALANTNNQLYLSASVFSTAVLIGGTVNTETSIANPT